MSSAPGDGEEQVRSQCGTSNPQPGVSEAHLNVLSAGRPSHRTSEPIQLKHQIEEHHYPACKVSPFKPNVSKSRKLPSPILQPISLRDETSRLESPCHRNQIQLSERRPKMPRPDADVLVKYPYSARFHASSEIEREPLPPNPECAIAGTDDACALRLPFKLEVPSPPSLSSSDEDIVKPPRREAKTYQDQGQTAERRGATKVQQSASPCDAGDVVRKSPVTDTCDPPESSQDSAFFSFCNPQSGFFNYEVGNEFLDQEEKTPIEELSTVVNTKMQPCSHTRYYTRAFDYVVTEVLNRYSFILSSQDIDIARILCTILSENAKALFVRIYGRKQPQWYRVSKLDGAYSSEIKVSEGINELCRERLLISSDYALKGSPKAASLLARELVSALELSEIRAACGSVVDGSSLRRLPRNRLIPALRKLLSNPYSSRRTKKKLSQTTLTGLKPEECLARTILKLSGHSVRVPDYILSSLKRMRFLFFLNDGYDSPNVILADVGKVRFPAYKCQPERGIFPSFQALETYESATELEQCINEALERKDWPQAAYFGSVAELEVREFLRCYKGGAEYEPSRPARRRVKTEERLSSLEKHISSHRPALVQLNDRREQIEQLNHPFLRRYTAQWVFVRSCWHSVYAMERMMEYKGAVNRLKLLLSTNLMPRRRGKCLARLTINLFKHLGKLEEPLQIIVSALSSSESRLQVGDQIGLAQRGAAIHMKLIKNGMLSQGQRGSPNKVGRDRQDLVRHDSARPGVIAEALEKATVPLSVRKIFGKSLNIQSKEEKEKVMKIQDPWQRYIEESQRVGQLDGLKANLPLAGKSVYRSHLSAGGCVSVEEYCLEWYSAKEQFAGVHDEGKAIRFLFTLLLWESALFAEIPDVFQTPYQDRPLDLSTEAFYLSRREKIDIRLEEIALMSSSQIYEETLNCYQKFDGIKAVGCMWTSYSSETIACIAAGLGGQGVAHCCRLLAEDYGYWGGGLPDLTLWRVDDDITPKQCGTKLVEVKSARDSLSERQRAWLIELTSNGVECEVCKVVERVTAKNADDIKESKLDSVAISQID